MDNGATPLVLLCPAWKNWGTATNVKPNTIILHSRKDDVIPFCDSEELIANSGLPSETRPPQMESNPSGNTFTLTLDWRTIPDNYNEFWKDRLGVKLSPSEATILNLSVDGLTVENAASATGLPLDSAQEAIDTLVRQALVDDKKKRYVIKSHLKELLEV
jgi:hypothetical protein